VIISFILTITNQTVYTVHIQQNKERRELSENHNQQCQESANL